MNAVQMFQQRAAAALAKYDDLNPTLPAGRIAAYHVRNEMGQTLALPIKPTDDLKWYGGKDSKKCKTTIISPDADFIRALATKYGGKITLANLNGITDDQRSRDYFATIREQVSL